MEEPGCTLASQGLKLRNGAVFACNGLGLKNILHAGKQWLALHVDQLNRQNVFPVPDGDTGTNMVLTMQAVLREIERIADHRVETIATAAAQGALMGARGNSGVILSQFFSGLSVGLTGKEMFTAADFAVAVEAGVVCAYRSVVDPVEGTILTVSQAVAKAACRTIETNQNLIDLFAAMVEAGRAAQARTPELLPVLKEAGVTDSGGLGLLYILEGALRFLQGQSFESQGVSDQYRDKQPVNFGSTNGKTPGSATFEKQNYGYDVQFLLYGQNLDIEAIQAHLMRFGDSTLVVGNPQLVKVHVHSHDPDQPLNYGLQLGLVTDLLVEDMTAQVELFLERERLLYGATLTARPEINQEILFLAIVPGQGLTHIFQRLGCDQVVLYDPSTPFSISLLRDILSRVEAKQIVILPNNYQIMTDLQERRHLLEKDVTIVPTETIPQGIAAIVACNIAPETSSGQQADLSKKIQRMIGAAKQVDTIELLQHVYYDNLNESELAVENIIGLFQGTVKVTGPDYVQVLLDLLAQVNLFQYELVTIYYGRGGSQAQADSLAKLILKKFSGLDVEIYFGGQPHSHYIISLE